MKQTLLLLTALAALLFLLAGCSAGGNASGDADASDAYIDVDPTDLTAILDMIYADVDLKGLLDAGDVELQDLFYIDPLQVDSDYAIRYSNGRYGVADVAIIRSLPEHMEAIQSALQQRRNDRIAEFENYDVHDSFRIAKDAEIYTRGNYVIMVMLPDELSESASKIILENIPG